MLHLREYIDLPPHLASEFDHGDVLPATGRVFVAHTAANTVEVLDGVGGRHLTTIPGCIEGSGVLCAPAEDLVFAAARGAGALLVIAAQSGAILRTVGVGPRPNGLAWDAQRRQLLVADVQENTARLIDTRAEPDGRLIATAALPGRPRWTVYDAQGDRFLLNIREPACVVVLAGGTEAIVDQWPVAVAGPHGLDIDHAGRRVFVACDGAAVVTLDLASGREVARVPIAGPPDAIWYNPQREHLYVAIAAPGVVEVVDTRAQTVTQRVVTEAGAHTTAFDSARQRLYVFLPATCRAAVYEVL